jgi:hypothetical protein
MMYRVFIEYKIDNLERTLFLSLLPAIEQFHRKRWNIEGYSVFEGTDQKNLFVEEFNVNNLGDFENIKHNRKNCDSKLWLDFNKCILGSRKKINIWAFKKINLKVTNS